MVGSARGDNPSDLTEFNAKGVKNGESKENDICYNIV